MLRRRSDCSLCSAPGPAPAQEPPRRALPVLLTVGYCRSRDHCAGLVAECRNHLLELALADEDLDAHHATDVPPGQEAAAVVQLLERRRRRLGLVPGVRGRVPGEEAPGRHPPAGGRRPRPPGGAAGEQALFLYTPSSSSTSLASYSTEAKSEGKVNVRAAEQCDTRPIPTSLYTRWRRLRLSVSAATTVSKYTRRLRP